MSGKVSIVIPCYNSEATLREAVDSAIRQRDGLKLEIVLVDDGSTDLTPQIIKGYADRYDFIKALRHEKNRGGGAARNTGIAASGGEHVLCLDSDNMLGDGAVSRMVEFLHNKGCDGVLFEKRVFFMHNPKRGQQERNDLEKDPVSLGNLFTDGHNVLDNFLMSKASWEAAGRFPENHGFDTQCFETRYLAAGLRVYTCPGSVVYHRYSKNHDSYFQRVYQSGLFSRNFYLIYEDIFHLLSDRARRVILDFDIFGRTASGKDGLMGVLSDLYSDDPDSFFVANKEQYMLPDGFKVYLSEHNGLNTVEQLACAAIFDQKKGDYSGAIEKYQRIISDGYSSPVVYFNLLRAFVGLSGEVSVERIEDRVGEVSANMNPKKRPIGPYRLAAHKILDFARESGAFLRTKK